MTPIWAEDAEHGLSDNGAHSHRVGHMVKHPQELSERKSPVGGRVGCWLVGLAASALLAGCAGGWKPGEPTAEPVEPRSNPQGLGPAPIPATLLRTPDATSPWALFPLPGKTAMPFLPVLHQGRPALRVQADRSVSILRQRLHPALPAVGMLRFSWMTDALPPEADVSTTVGDDSPVRVLLAFDGDRARLSPQAARMSELSRLLTGEPLPYATLMYVWSPSHPVGAIVANPRTDRIRKWVLDTGNEQLGTWRDHERDVRADFIQAFGEEPGPLLSVALMTDTDNTASRLQAWYGPLSLMTAEP